MSDAGVGLICEANDADTATSRIPLVLGATPPFYTIFIPVKEISLPSSIV